MSADKVSRRGVLEEAAGAGGAGGGGAGGGVAALPGAAMAQEGKAAGGTRNATEGVPYSARDFVSAWDKTPDRVWLGPEYWANPLQDWRVAGGGVAGIRGV